MRYKQPMIEAICAELKMRKEYLKQQPIQTIYFGGGTPSLLKIDEIQQIIDTIQQCFPQAPNQEITLEANPDDLSFDELQKLYNETPVNRLSIGVQSFFEEDLLFMNRAHNANQASRVLEDALKAGFSNITIDLIYGTPTMSHERWRENIQKAFDFNIPHISCYALTVEPQTALSAFIKKGKVAPLSEEHSARQFEILLEELAQYGYEQYEISNFCRDAYYAKHNTNYWKGVHYLGIGPSAHSFNGVARQWNIAHNQKYIQSINKGLVPQEEEVLTPVDQFNEYLLTGLRTKWGVDKTKIKNWGAIFEMHLIREVQPFLKKGLVEEDENYFTLTPQGRLLADHIISHLFRASS